MPIAQCRGCCNVLARKLQKSTRLVEMANNLNVGVDEDDTEQLLDVVPEKLINQELLEQEHITEQAREESCIR